MCERVQRLRAMQPTNSKQVPRQLLNCGFFFYYYHHQVVKVHNRQQKGVHDCQVGYLMINLTQQMVCYTEPSGKLSLEPVWARVGTRIVAFHFVIGQAVCFTIYHEPTSTNQKDTEKKQAAVVHISILLRLIFS